MTQRGHGRLALTKNEMRRWGTRNNTGVGGSMTIEKLEALVSSNEINPLTRKPSLTWDGLVAAVNALPKLIAVAKAARMLDAAIHAANGAADVESRAGSVITVDYAHRQLVAALAALEANDGKA